MGRPSTYSPQIVAEICARLSDGEPLAEICRDENMPAVRTVNDWRKAREEVSAEFARARDVGHDAIAARTRRTARGFGPELGGDSTADVQRDKLIIDTDLKLLAKWDPRRYGDRVEVEHSGSIAQMSESQVEARLAQLIGKAGAAGALGGEGAAAEEE